MSLVEIACDESGSEGENLIGAASRVFTHASTILSAEEARDLVENVADGVRADGREVKSSTLLARRHRELVETLFGSDGPLAGRCAVMIADKEFFVVAKVIDLLVEELAHSGGRDLYSSGRARLWARELHFEGLRALGEQRWGELLARFNSLMRVKQRKGDKSTVDDFFTVVDLCRSRSHRRRVSDVLDLVARARPHAESFQARLVADPTVTPDLDPIIPGLMEAARHWYQAFRQPVAIIHDRQSVLTEQLIEDLLREANDPFPEFVPWTGGRIKLVSIEQADSRDDPRIQVADWVAGVIRAEAAAALLRTREPAHWARRYVLPASPWSDPDSWGALTGTPPAR